MVWLHNSAPYMQVIYYANMLDKYVNMQGIYANM